MYSKAVIATLATFLPSAFAAVKGFNYGSTYSDGTLKVQADYEGEFNSAQKLTSAPSGGFNSARLYTMLQGTTGAPNQAIPAAIATKTSLLLGLWASAGQDSFNQEVSALTAAISQYGTSFTDLIIGISVGSEDVYRTTALGIASNAGAGASPDTIVSYVNQVRGAIKGTGASSAPVGHVDTYNVWANTSYTAGLIDAVDFLGVDAYPYYETTKANSIENANETFWGDYNTANGVSNGKPVWITETGWPSQGPTSGQAVASLANSATYYSEVACSLFAANVNTWYFTLQDDQPVVPSSGVVFAVTGQGNPPPTTPLFSLSC